jgi:hypothetical protein
MAPGGGANLPMAPHEGAGRRPGLCLSEPLRVCGPGAQDQVAERSCGKIEIQGIPGGTTAGLPSAS